jgi:predicted Zn-dependent protease
MFCRRIVPLAIILSLLCASTPAPVLALSTASEIQLGKEQDKEIVQSYVIENDPLLNAYVQKISDNLWKQVARKDVPYTIRIIKGNDVNAFSTLGGYVYVYEGLIDFVQSDDELAGVIGHETGHIERRHTITMAAKAQALNLLFGILSMFSPFIYRFGNIAEAGIMARMSRDDEVQADRYGLQLMSRAGYDPDAMVSMMRHLGVLESEHSDLLTKYLADHPAPGARVARMVGYPELDPTKITPDQKEVQALSDAERARYNVAMLKLTTLLKTQPDNADELLRLGQMELALGQTNKSAQTLALAAQKGNSQTRVAALARIASLRQLDSKRVSLMQPNLSHLRAQIQIALQTQTEAGAQVQARRDQGREQIKSLQARVDAIGYEFPDMSRVNIRNGSRLEAIMKNIEAMARSINSGIEDSSSAVEGVGSLERGKEGGLLKENADILKEMQAPLDSRPIPADSLTVLPYYPKMLNDLSLADGDMVRAVDAGRASALLLDNSLGDLDIFLRQLSRVQLDYFGDISLSDYNLLMPSMQKSIDSLNKGAIAAGQAAQLYNLARSRQLSTRITMLGVGNSPQRYATLQYSLQHRFDSSGLTYEQMLHANVTPGDVVAATIVAADMKSTPLAIVQEAKQSGRTLVDTANQRGMHAWPLEIFMGLVYLDYTDDPVKEAQHQ